MPAGAALVMCAALTGLREETRYRIAHSATVVTSQLLN
jgi:hypothetical protein